jgi:ArsR family transcriptional regulator, arsenate/arsenite/antimonite-responsive transcriptional repressor / arsenate reductase (thioredoxin)
VWGSLAGAPAASAGTQPADAVHRGAVAAARRAGIDVTGARPRALDEVDELPALVITVCDRAHEELPAGATWLHWSIPDPVPTGTHAAFDATVAELRDRIGSLLEARAA